MLRMIQSMYSLPILLFVASCGGGADGETGGGAQTSSAGAGASCVDPFPSCSVVANPSSSQFAPLPAGSTVTLSPSCNVSDGVLFNWFTNGQTISTDRQIQVTPPANSITGYGLSYSNCRGGGAAGTEIFVTGASGSGGSTDGSAGSAGGAGNSNSTTVGTNAGTVANQCVGPLTNTNIGFQVQNRCSVPIQVSFCTADSSDPNSANSRLLNCRATRDSISPSGFNYTRASFKLRPGQSDVVSGYRAGETLFFAACEELDGEFVVPKITGFDQQTITRGAQAFVFCSKSQ